MNKFTAPTGESPLDGDVAEVRQLLRGVRGALSTLRDRMELDEDAAGGANRKGFDRTAPPDPHDH